MGEDAAKLLATPRIVHDYESSILNTRTEVAGPEMVQRSEVGVVPGG